MGVNGGTPLSWSRLERILAGRKSPTPVPVDHLAAPASRGPVPAYPALPFAELHAVSSYSFLGGASDPEVLVRRAVGLSL